MENYLKNIKSSGIYRFVFDNTSQPVAEKQTMRLMVGYSEKGLFNTPVYIDDANDFKKIFGDTSKKLERYGDGFHRMCLEALSAGPIYALNVKNFQELDSYHHARVYELTVGNTYYSNEGTYFSFDSVVSDIWDAIRDKGYTDAHGISWDDTLLEGVKVMVYNTQKNWEVKSGVFYKEDGENLVDKTNEVQELIFGSQGVESAKEIKDKEFFEASGEITKGVAFTGSKMTAPSGNVPTNTYNVTDLYDKTRFWYLDPKNLHTHAEKKNYITLAATDSKNCSNTIFIEQYKPKGYSITFKDWFSTVMQGEEMPSYLESVQNEKLEDYFLRVWVFKGEINNDLANTESYKKYFSTSGTTVKFKKYITNAFGENVSAVEAFAANSKSNFVNVYSGIVLPDFVTASNTALSLVDVFNSDNQNHKMMMNFDTDGLYDGTYYLGSINNNVPSETVMCTGGGFDYSGGNEGATAYYLPGYVYANSSPAGSSDAQKLAWQNYIIAALKGTSSEGYKGLRMALTDRKNLSFRYLVDCFDSFITTNMKSVFSSICAARENALPILNWPKAEVFKRVSTYMENGTINFQKVVDDTANISLADEDNGASFAYYVTPVNFRNVITGNKFSVSSAALVSNAFMAKYDTRYEFSIVAGPDFGSISYANLVGPDYNFSQEDRDVLEPYGVNCLVYAPGVGTYINSNQTAKQNPVTALSKAHIRELVIFLGDEIERLLQSYQWHMNTPALRDTIATKAQSILGKCKDNQGIYDFTVQCDDRNNPAEVIDNDMIILDYSVEPARGAGKMVQRLTIKKTGEISNSAQ